MKNKKTPDEMKDIERIVLRSNFEYGIQVIEKFFEYEKTGFIPDVKVDQQLLKRLDYLYKTQSLERRQQLSYASGRTRIVEDIRDYSLNDMIIIAKRLNGINPVLGIPLNAGDIGIDRCTDEDRYEATRVIFMTKWINDGKGCKESVFKTKKSLQDEKLRRGWEDKDDRMVAILIIQEHLKSWKLKLLNGRR